MNTQSYLLQSHKELCDFAESPDSYHAFNQVLLAHRDELASMLQAPGMEDSKWFDAPTKEECEARLQMHRFIKQFFEPNDAFENKLRVECWERFLKTERHLRRNNARLVRHVKLQSGQFGLLLKIRHEIAKILSQWRFNPHLAWFGPGETFASSGGDTSVYAKLAEGEWTCTAHVLPYLAKVVRSNRCFRRIQLERARLGCKAKVERLCDELLHGILKLRLCVKRVKAKYPRVNLHEFLSNVGKRYYLGSFDAAVRQSDFKLHPDLIAVARIYLRCRALIKVRDFWKARAEGRRPLTPEQELRLAWRIVPGNRFDSVPKDNTKRRSIAVEPLGNLLVQKAVGLGLKLTLRANGNCLFTGQQRHRMRVRTEAREIATIDFSDASNSISMLLCRLLLPTKLLKLVEAARAPMTYRREGDGIDIHPNYLVSSMGNGFTFELMSLILLALGRALGADDTSVFGDDVILLRGFAPKFMEAARVLGFTVNEDKSFFRTTDRVRESCGEFTYDGESLTSYDLEWVDDPVRLAATMNKLYTMSEAPYMGSYWKKLRKELLPLTPLNCQSLVPSSARARADCLGMFIWLDGIECDMADLDRGRPACGEFSRKWLSREFFLDPSAIRAVTTWQFEPKAISPEGVTPRARQFAMVGLRLRAGTKVSRVVRDGSFKPVTVYTVYGEPFITARAYKRLSKDDYNVADSLGLFLDGGDKDGWTAFWQSRHFVRDKALTELHA